VVARGSNIGLGAGEREGRGSGAGERRRCRGIEFIFLLNSNGCNAPIFIVPSGFYPQVT
jgi:hypothetical protein